jgi:glycosyltransferase involved in cell wall biosynthesis
MVASTPVPEINGVTAVYPSKRCERILGRSAARLYTFVRTCKVRNADLVGGFHLLLNGLVAHLVAAMRGMRSLYICGGGVREVEGGGFRTQNKLFMKIGYESKVIERLLVRTACDIDYIVTMGTSVRDFFQERGARGAVVVIPGGFDTNEFSPPSASVEKEFDLITVGRVSSVKRPDIFIDIVDQLNKQGVRAKAVIVGDGPLLGEVREDVTRRGIDEFVTFAGWQSDVVPWLKSGRIFLLTSESEGLSQALIQAMLCGLPAVVTDVGDLSDLVVEGENGFLINELSAELFVKSLLPLLTNPQQFDDFSRASRLAAERFSNERISQIWTGVFRDEQ